MSPGTPPAEVHVDAALLQRLLTEQHPDLAALSIELFDVGWDNYMFRLGDALVIRLPRRELAARLIIHEQDWLPVVARNLPLPTPIPVRLGMPGCGYPWRWSVLPWLPGTSANLAPPDDNQADTLAAFLKSVHQPAPENAPVHLWRGVPLADRAEAVESRLNRLRSATSFVTPQVDEAWRRALAAPRATERLWLHGDLHARNVLVQDGVLCGVIDWGDITSGDPATDLACIWGLFENPSARERVLVAYGADEDLRTRAQGWAVLFAAMLLDTGLVDNPLHARMGESIFTRISADE